MVADCSQLEKIGVELQSFFFSFLTLVAQRLPPGKQAPGAEISLCETRNNYCA